MAGWTTLRERGSETEGGRESVFVRERQGKKYENQGEVKEKRSHGNLSLKVIIVVSGN